MPNEQEHRRGPFTTATKFRSLSSNTFTQSSQNLNLFDLVEGINDEQSSYNQKKTST